MNCKRVLVTGAADLLCRCVVDDLKLLYAVTAFDCHQGEAAVSWRFGDPVAYPEMYGEIAARAAGLDAYKGPMAVGPSAGGGGAVWHQPAVPRVISGWPSKWPVQALRHSS